MSAEVVPVAAAGFAGGDVLGGVDELRDTFEDAL